jgi:hypothetical protein
MTTLAPLATLARRRFQLTAASPRELVVPLLTPILFALVIAPALKEALHTSTAYESFVATGTIGLLIPLNTMFAGLGVIVDRENGAQRELLAAPVPRALLVLGNLAVALAVTALQVIVLLVVAAARGIDFHAPASRGSSPRACSSRSACTASPRLSPAACREPRSTSPVSPRLRSSRGSSPARSSRLRHCRAS